MLGPRRLTKIRIAKLTVRFPVSYMIFTNARQSVHLSGTAILEWTTHGFEGDDGGTGRRAVSHPSTSSLSEIFCSGPATSRSTPATENCGPDASEGERMRSSGVGSSG